MEYQKITHLLDTTSENLPRFIAKKLVEVHDQPGSAGDGYKQSKQIIFKTSMLISDLRDFSDAYSVAKGTITIADPDNDACHKKLAFKNNALFIFCISKINNTLIDNAEDLDFVIPMYNLLEYSQKYSKTTGSLWNYYRDEPNSGVGGENDSINYSIENSKSFEYKTSITGKFEGNNPEKEVEIVVSLKHLSNFWRTLDMTLINCELKLTLTWSENCVLTTKAYRGKIVGTGTYENPQFPEINNPTNATFQRTDTRLYVPVVTFSTQNDNKLLKQLRTGFKRTIKWNKYRLEMTNQTKSNNLNFLIDPTFTKVNRLSVLSFENENDRTSFSKYYVPNVQIKDFNVLIDRKSFFDIPIKNDEQTYKQIIYIGRNNDYTTGNFLGYEYFSKHYKLIAIDLSRQIELESPDLKQQINFSRRLEINEAATIFFITEKSEETTFQFTQNVATVA